MRDPVPDYPPASNEPTSAPEIEKMCQHLSEVREFASTLENKARDVELRILGPTPTDEGELPKIAESLPCLTGIIVTTSREIHSHLRHIGRSLDRILQELGVIGGEGGAPR